MRKELILLLGMVLLSWATVHSSPERDILGLEPGQGKSFLYIARKLGVPILRFSLQIQRGASDQGRPIYQIEAHVESLTSIRFLYRVNNHFTSIVETETFIPLQFVKVIDQDGLLARRRNYIHTLTFDAANNRVILDKKGEKDKREILLPAGTYDPLSVFARYYLGEGFPLAEEITLSIYDGVRFRDMIFRSKKEAVNSRLYGEVEAVRLESTTSFSSFDDKEGVIRIWYTADRERTPILVELDLPVGSVTFELESVERMS